MTQVGGTREGIQGRAYGNRTDLNERRQPVRAAPSRQYGERARSEAQQRALPLPDLRPGQVRLDAPSDRPDEPITAGLPLGAGPDPEILGLPGTNPREADVEKLRRYLPTLELLAAQPRATDSFRTWVRQIRSHLPPEGSV